MSTYTYTGNNLTNMNESLDQFYTKREIAISCWIHFTNILPSLSKTVNDLFFVEPSAGTGAFYDQLPQDRRLGIDLVPKCEDVRAQDFFAVCSLPKSVKETAIIGNPPFGKRGKLAIAFFNHAAFLSDIVAFIVPLSFRKYAVHKCLDPGMRYISKMILPRDAFILDNGKPFSVNTEFQIWTRIPSKHKDMRQNKPLPICHQDFQIWQYNNTTTSLKVFSNSFDFAVPCQGWQDYTRKETDERGCERNKQWILLKAKDPNVLKRLMRIDYERLAQESATAVPGFRKADLVKEYTDNYE